MTISSLAKIIAGVNKMVVENVEIEDMENDPTLIFRVRPIRKDSCRCGICGRKCSGYDQGNGRRRWRALDIGNSIRVCLESDAPRVWCKEHGVVVQMAPWARHGSKFTRNFEDTAVWMSLYLSRKAVSEYLRVSWDTVGAIVGRVEKETRSQENRFDGLVRIGIDETSYKKGWKYITVVINHETNSVIWAAKGSGREVLERFFQELTPAQRESIELVSADGARWIRDTVADYCPKATFCIDPFHVVSWAENVLDINAHNGNYNVSTLYTDLAAEYEKLGDYVMNVVEARLGKRYLTFRGLQVNLDHKTVFADGTPIDLTRTEFGLLCELLSAHGLVRSRQQLIDSVWSGTIVTDRTVDVHIARLRRKLGPYAENIANRPGFGYFFNVVTEKS